MAGLAVLHGYLAQAEHGPDHAAVAVRHLRRASANDPGRRIDVFENVGNRVLVLVVQQLRQPFGEPLDTVQQLRCAVEQCG